MLPYAAYLRVYEPLTAFPPRDQTRWARYVGSPDRPRRASALEAEYRESLRRLLRFPPIPAPARESLDAYLRRVGSTLYVCPWQTRLRSWLAFAEFRGSVPVKIASRFVPRTIAERTAADFDHFKRSRHSLRTYVRTSAWHVPIAWFVPFDSTERWLVLGTRKASEPAAPTTTAPSTTAPPRNMLYVTSMAQARRRVARALVVIRRHLGHVTVLTEVEEVGRWLEEFHPHSLVELDYGGLVHLMDDATLESDQSVAELRAALAGLDNGQEELAVAMYQRLIVRWRSIKALRSAN